MASPALIVIQGAPASGKTTLCNSIRDALSIPILGKDDIKELLFDRLEQSDREYSKLQGIVSFNMLYAFAESFLHEGKSVIIEGAFYTEISRENISEVLKRTNARHLEIYCHVDELTRRQRFANRSNDGTRHSAHLDRTLPPNAMPDKYQQLGLGECISVDTTSGIDEAMCQRVVSAVRNLIE